jgi:hypothetical protein
MSVIVWHEKSSETNAYSGVKYTVKKASLNSQVWKFLLPHILIVHKTGPKPSSVTRVIFLGSKGGRNVKFSACTLYLDGIV